MKVPLIALFVLAMSTSLSMAQSGPATALERLHLAIAAADQPAAAAMLAADVQIFESGFVERSRDEYLAQHFAADAAFAKGVTRKVVRHAEQVAGTMALVMEETETTGSHDGKPIRLIGTETAVLRLEKGAWKIVHIHWSSRKP